MSTNSNYLLFLLLVINQIVVSTGQNPARTTLLITGHSSNNLYKYAFAQKYASEIELDRAHPADIVVISSDSPDFARQDDGVSVRTIGGLPASSNFSHVVISRMGTQEMSLDHIQVLYEYINTDEPLIAVEIGEQSVQTRALLNKGALCWGEARANILSPNRVYLCNDVSPETVKKVVDIESIHSLEEEIKLTVNVPPRPFWPSLFVSAAKAERKHRKKEAQEVIEVEEDDVEEIVDRIMENMEKSPPKQTQHKSKEPAGKKLGCKYRKSCYDSGKLPEIEEIPDWFDLDAVTSYFSWGEKKEDRKQEAVDEDDDEENLTPRKLKCKYRLDCYKEKGIKLTGKDGEREERKILLAGKTAPQQGKKRTLKEIAEKTMQKVKVAEEKAAARPLSHAQIAERRMNAMEEKLTEKLQCKYRKSCYESGDLPVIENAWSFPIVFSTHTAEEAVEEVDFKEMEDLEKKVFCKYRKSCYDTGVKPNIEPELQIRTFSDIVEIPDVIETRKMTIQEKCKYRKSCYETGILPDLNPQIEKDIIQKEVANVVPTNMNELKKFCKYRKSCYEEIAQSAASAETVKNIRKRRIIEKEVRRRKVRRARMRRRLRDIELEATSADKKHKSKRYVVQANETGKPEEELPETEVKAKKGKMSVEEAVPIPEPVVKFSKKKAPVVEKSKEEEEPPKLKKVKKEEAQPEPEVVEQTKPKKRSKKTVEPLLAPIVEEAVPTPEDEPEPVKKQKQKKPKKTEVMEEEQEEDKIEETPAVKVNIHKEKKERGHKHSESKVNGESERMGYKEKQDLQMHCKYRKSCYDTKERPVIHQTLSTLYEKFDSHVNEHYDKLENKELSAADKKLACKYRRSCYESNKRPVIVQTLSSLWGGASSVPVEREHIQDKGLSQAQRNLRCKYRKSCYETGELPEILYYTPVHEYGEEPVEVENWHKKESKKLACKYRPSCYEKQGWSFGREVNNEDEEKVKTVREVKKEAPAVKEEKVKEQNVATEPKKKTKLKPVPIPKIEEEDEKKNEEKEKKVEVKEEEKVPEIAEEDLPNLERGEKLSCKYRKSCYLNNTPAEAPTRTVTVGGVSQRTKCNQYYLSCREKLGLPPKEKAPIGPSGRKLCRKKKIDK